jgi:ribosomal RNA-processing protein 12
MDFEMDISSDISDNSDLGAAVLRRFEVSRKEEHQRLCAAVGAMSQSLKDQSIPLTPVAYFSATTSSLDRLSKDPASASDPITSSLVVFLSFCVPAVPVAVVRSTGASVCVTVVRILGFGSLSDNGVKAGLKCIAGLIVAGDKSSWSNLSPSFGVVLRSATDYRPKVASSTNKGKKCQKQFSFSHAI